MISLGRVRLDWPTVRTGALVLAGGIVAFHSVREHSVELGLEDTLNQIGLGSLAASLKPKPNSSLAGPAPDPSSVHPQANTEPSGPLCYGNGDLDAMRAANPEIDTLLAGWKGGIWSKVQLGYQTGPYDWAGFRSYVLRFGYPDPGSNPTQGFCQ